MTSFAIPFSLTPTGHISTVTDPNVVANNRMESLISTYPGERVMIPDYGTPIPNLLFAPELASQQSIIELQVQQAVNQWEPTLVVNSINVDFSQNTYGIANVNVDFSLSNDPTLTPPQTVTIAIGGTVINGA